MVVKKTRAKVAKGGCLVGLKGKAKGCKIGRTAPRNVGKEKTHKMPNGDTHTGKTHTAKSKLVKSNPKPLHAKKHKRMTARELQEHNEMERRKTKPNEGKTRKRRTLPKVPKGRVKY